MATTSPRSSGRSAPSTRSTDRPKVDHRRHREGEGRVSFMEGPAMKAGELYGYHSGAPGEAAVHGRARGAARVGRQPLRRARPRARSTPRRARAIPRREPRQTDNLIAAYDRALLCAGGEASATSSCSTPIWSRTAAWCRSRSAIPDRFIECGIAEQDMVSMAAGMARRGALPIVHSFACFLVRAAERADLQPVQRSHEGHLRRLAGRAAARRPGPFASVGARHLGARGRAEARAAPSRARKPRSARSSTISSTGVSESVVPAARVGEVADAVRLSAGSTRSRSAGAGSCATATMPWCSATARGCLANAFEAAEEIEQSDRRRASASSTCRG